MDWVGPTTNLSSLSPFLQLVVVVYVLVIMWLVSSNFRSAAASAAASSVSSSRGFTRFATHNLKCWDMCVEAIKYSKTAETQVEMGKVERQL